MPSPPDVFVAPSAAAGMPPALPVWLDVTEDRQRVRRFVEIDLGWQAIDAATARLIPPVVRLVDPGTQRRPDDPAIPTVMLLSPSDHPAAERWRQQADYRSERRRTVTSPALVAAADDRVVEVLVWPDERATLPQIVARLRSDGLAAAPGRTLTVGGAAGGVGTTTVVLALAGLAGWAGTTTMALVRGDVAVPNVRTVGSEATAATDLWARACRLPGVSNARVLAVDDPGRPADVTDVSIGLTVVDAGVDHEVDLLVVRRDRAGQAHASATTAGTIVVVDDGPLSFARCVHAAGPRRIVVVAWSTRVARAGVARRIPSGLSGVWLRPLADLIGMTGTARQVA